MDGEAIFDVIADDLRRPRAVFGARRRSANRRDPQILSSRQPREHVDPRGGDDLDSGADDGRLQQPRVVQTGRKAESAGIHPAGTGRKLVVGRGPHEAHLQTAARCQMARLGELHLRESWVRENCTPSLSDGKPFTAADVKCTWDMLTGKSQEKLRLNPRKAWYRNLEGIVPDGDHAVTFVLKRSQPAFLMLLASGMSPVYPCHVNPRDMRTHLIGTGPFKFAEFKPNEFIRVVKNPGYWKPGRPYLDGIEWTIIPNRSTQTLAFIAGKFDMSFPYEVTLQSMRDIQNQAPNAICEMTPTPVAMNLLINRDAAPFDDPDIRRAMQLAIDRKSFLDIIAEGQGDINGAMQSPPAGLWGLPPDILVTLPGYGPDVAANRAEARKLMERHGYGPDHRLAVKVATRNIAQYRDPAIILIDQMKEIYIDGELDAVETVNWFPKIARKDYMVGANLSGSGVDD